MDDAVVTATTGQPCRHASPFWPADVMEGVETKRGRALKNTHSGHTLIRKHCGRQWFWGGGVEVEGGVVGVALWWRLIRWIVGWGLSAPH